MYNKTLYSVLKRGALCHRAQVKPEATRLNETDQTWEGKHCTTLVMCGIKEGKVRRTETENETVLPWMGWWEDTNHRNTGRASQAKEQHKSVVTSSVIRINP